LDIPVPVASGFRRTTLPVKVVDQNNFAAEFYHLKVENPIFRVFSSI